MQRKFHVPSDAEEAEINAGISADSETVEWTEEMFQQAKLLDELPTKIKSAIKGRGVQKKPTKIQLSIRLSPEVINYFKSSGKGWQTRLDEALKEYVHNH